MANHVLLVELEGNVVRYIDELGREASAAVHSMHKCADGRIHFTFFTSWTDKYWAILWKNSPNIRAKRYKNFQPVVGGSGHNNTAYLRNRAMRR